MPKNVLLAVLIAAALAASLASGQWVETVIHLPDSLCGATELHWLEFDSLTNTIYAAGWRGTVAIDATTYRKVARLPYMGGWVGFDRELGKMYICGDSVYVLDPRTRSLMRTIPVAADFVQVIAPAALCTTYHKLYVAAGDSLAIIDTRGDTVIRYVQTGTLRGLCLAEPERKLYYRRRGGLAAVDCRTDSVTTSIGLPMTSYRPLAYNPSVRKLYYASMEGVHIVDCRADTVVKVVGQGTYFAYAFCDPHTNRFYAVHACEAVVEIDCSSDSLMRFIPTGRGEVVSAYYSPVVKKYYVLDADWGGAIVDCAGDTVVGYFGKGVGDWCGPFGENPGAREVYCGDFGYGVVTVLDGAGDTIKAAVITSEHYGVGPLWYNALSDKVYGLDRFVGGLSVIDGASNRLERTRVVAAKPEGLVYNGAAQELYTLDIDGRQIVAISAFTDTVAAVVDCPRRPGLPICANATASKLFCTVPNSNNLWSIGSTNHVIGDTIRLPFRANVLASSPDAAKVYAADGYYRVAVVDAVGDSVLREVVLPSRVTHMRYSPRQRRWYLLSRSDSVFVLDGASDSLLATLAAPHGGGVIWNGATDRLYYDSDSSGSGFVVVFDCGTNQVVGRLSSAGIRACDSVRNRVYCVSDSTLLVFDGANDSLIARVTVPNLGYVAVNPTNGRVYVGSGYSDVYVIRDPLAIEETTPVGQRGRPTIFRNMMHIPLASGVERQASGACLLDISGRKVLDLLPGPNDVRGLAPGVYFVAERTATGEQRVANKVIVAR